MRVAQVGVGRLGHLHAEVLASVSQVDELVLADADTARAEKVADAIGVQAVDVDAAIGEADALVIVAATDAHPSLIRAGLARGIPMFCEKPLALEFGETVR